MNTVSSSSVRERDILVPDGRQVHVYESGDPHGEVVVYHHGTPGSGSPAPWWSADAAARGIRLVGYDRPGYRDSHRQPGRSVGDAAADVAAIADVLGVARFRTWGDSGGGPHALACAAALPDRVIAAGVVACVAPFHADGLEWSAGMGQDNLDEFAATTAGEAQLRSYLARAREQIAASGPDGLAEAMRSLLPPVDVAALDPEVASYAYANLMAGLRSGTDGWLDDDISFVRPWGFDPASITVPVLVVHGAQDLMVPFAHGRWLAATVPTATARLFETDGHLSLVRAIDQVHAWLLAQPA